MKPTYEELQATCESLTAALAKTQHLLKLALDRIAELEEKINKNSKNSSTPPSKDRKPNKDDTKKGDRKSRKGINRSPMPPEKVDYFVNCILAHCPDCGSDQLNKEEKFESLQQVELPEVKAIVTQFDCFRYTCTCCSSRSTASLPKGIPNSAFGPRLMSLIATLTGALHLAKRDVITLLEDLYGIDICEGSIINVEERVANAIDAVYKRIHSVVTKSILCKHFDESSWRDQGRNCYVWVAGTNQAVCFKIDASRSKKAFLNFVGTLTPSPVVTDRYAVYNDTSENHQYCLAHLIRDFRKYSERKGDDGKMGLAIEKELQKACKIHKRYRQEEIPLKTRDRLLQNSRKRLENRIYDGLANGSDDFAKFCESILDRFEKIWVFMKFADVEPTNNLAERDLRRIVLWRKKSYGTRSERGQRFVEKISSICGTLKRAKKKIMEFLGNAVSAFYSGMEAPFINQAYGY
jgi:transposase